MMHWYLTYWYKIVLRIRIDWWISLIIVGKIIFYQGGTTDHSTNVPVPVAQSGAESDYNTAYTVGMDLAHFTMLIHELLNKYPDIVPEEDPLIILDS